MRLKLCFFLLLPVVILSACESRTDAHPAAQKSAAPEGGYADVVVRDAAVYTLNQEQPWTEAVAIRGGEIVKVGSNLEVEPWIGPESHVISQPGGLVLPAFQDAHTHPLASGVDHFDCSLDIQPQTQQAYLDKVSECAKAMPDREWISGGGWLVTAFPPDGIPDKSLLDKVVADRPVVFFSADGHTAWTNSRALEIAGITAQTPDPQNGRIDRDPANGEPVGSFQEAAMDLIRAHLPPPPQSQIDEGMRYTIDYLHSLGITAMQEAHASIDPEDPLQALPTYRRFADSGELQMHTVISLGWDNDKGLEQIPDLVNARERYNGGLLNTDTVKIFLDGVVEPRTAALLQDYTDQPGYKGELQVPPELLNEAVARLDAEGFQVHMHVIGDAAVREGLDAIQFALQRNGPDNGRHHLAHVEFVNPADIGRFAELNVTATFSPLWAVEDTLPHRAHTATRRSGALPVDLPHQQHITGRWPHRIWLGLERVFARPAAGHRNSSHQGRPDKWQIRRYFCRSSASHWSRPSRLLPSTLLTSTTWMTAPAVSKWASSATWSFSTPTCSRSIPRRFLTPKSSPLCSAGKWSIKAAPHRPQ